MILIAAADEGGGLTFHNRRQSQDRILRQHILTITEGKRLWMDAYSARQFAGMDAPQITVAEDFLSRAESGDYCFIERCPSPFPPVLISQVILFRWNRRYPSDAPFPIRLEPPGWVMACTEDFAGYSHRKITKGVWNYEEEI